MERSEMRDVSFPDFRPLSRALSTALIPAIVGCAKVQAGVAGPFLLCSGFAAPRRESPTPALPGGDDDPLQSMIPKSGYRFSETIMLQEKLSL
jgi:hypothetical protein